MNYPRNKFVVEVHIQCEYDGFKGVYVFSTSFSETQTAVLCANRQPLGAIIAVRVWYNGKIVYRRGEHG